MLAAEIATQGLSNSAIARQLDRHRETIGLWLKAIQIEGLSAFLNQCAHAKKGPRQRRQVPSVVKRFVSAIRVRDHNCCGQKIQYVLACEQNVHLSIPTIYEILSERDVVRARGRTDQPLGAVPTVTVHRAVIQIDTAVFGEVFTFNGVDIDAKEAGGVLRPGLTSEEGTVFMHTAMARRFTEPMQIVQTDGSPEFKGALAQLAPQYCPRHWISRLYKKNEQADIESFNRTLPRECVGWTAYRIEELPALNAEVLAFLSQHHAHRPHLG